MSTKALTRQIRMTIGSEPRQICVARSAAETFAEREGFDEHAVGQVGLALNEALANVIEHGYEGEMNHPINVTMEMGEIDGNKMLKLVVKDFGQQIDPENIKGRDLDEVRPGGLGVHLIRASMDKAEYHCPPEGGMELTMIKYLNSNEGNAS